MKKSQWLFDNGVPRSGESYDSENEFIEPTIRQKTVNQNQEKTTSCRLFFTQSGTLIFVFFGIIISNADTLCLRHAFVMPSSCLRRGFAPKGEARCIQNGVKKSPSSPIRLSDEPVMLILTFFFATPFYFRIFVNTRIILCVMYCFRY